MAKSTEAVANTFSTVADLDRRCVLDYLAEQKVPVTCDRFAIRVAVWRTDCVPMRSGAESPGSSRWVPGG